MKRYIVLTLMCVVTISMMALINSATGSVRMLSQVEKESITGGLCHECPDCRSSADSSCGGVTGCTEVGGDCDDRTKIKKTKTKCTAGGSLDGGCGGSGSHECWQKKSCTCDTDPPGWTCKEGSWEAVNATYKKDPCW